MLVSGGDDCCLKLWDLRSPEQPVQNMAKFFTAGVTSAQWCPHRSQEHIYAVGSYDGSIALWDERMMRRTPLASVDSGPYKTCCLRYIALCHVAFFMTVLIHVDFHCTGGGVWRLKWNPDIDGSNDGSLYLGAASMHNGSGIYKIDPGSSFASDGALELTTFEIQQDVNEKRLVYGMDWLTKQAKSKIQEKDTVDEDNTDSNTIFKSVELNASASIKQRDFEIATCSFYDNLVQIWSC
jgi:WD40 repeat protein